MVVAQPAEAETQSVVEAPRSRPPEPVAAVEVLHPRACELVTAQEMSRILGKAVNAQGSEGYEKTGCTYSVAQGEGPYVEFSVNWGSAEGAMNMTRMLAMAEPDMAQPYSGIGDEATMVGSMLMIRSGEDLVILAIADVNDIAGKARRIFDTAKARM